VHGLLGSTKHCAKLVNFSSYFYPEQAANFRFPVKFIYGNLPKEFIAVSDFSFLAFILTEISLWFTLFHSAGS
jgi:hypothetical protein